MLTNTKYHMFSWLGRSNGLQTMVQMAISSKVFPARASVDCWASLKYAKTHSWGSTALPHRWSMEPIGMLICIYRSTLTSWLLWYAMQVALWLYCFSSWQHILWGHLRRKMQTKMKCKFTWSISTNVYWSISIHVSSRSDMFAIRTFHKTHTKTFTCASPSRWDSENKMLEVLVRGHAMYDFIEVVRMPVVQVRIIMMWFNVLVCVWCWSFECIYSHVPYVYK